MCVSFKRRGIYFLERVHVHVHVLMHFLLFINLFNDTIHEVETFIGWFVS